MKKLFNHPGFEDTKFDGGILINFNYEVCPVCNGTGQYDDEICHTCNGKRVVEKFSYDELPSEALKLIEIYQEGYRQHLIDVSKERVLRL